MRLSLKLIAFALASCALTSRADDQPQSLVNSLGLKMVFLGPGRLSMGSPDGEFDERPVHPVTITRPFYMAATEVTNAQYEQFDPAHKALRGKRGISTGDDEAVVFVSWNDAVKFCQWLSKKEGKPYRLPTEAEWEFACRAGTTTAYSTGEDLPAEFHKSQKFSWDPIPVSLRVGQTPPNSWGLHDMHGNVEEWCLDSYGPYPEEPQMDPVGRAGRRDESLSRWKPQHPGRFPAQCESLRHPGRGQALADRVPRGVCRDARYESRCRRFPPRSGLVLSGPRRRSGGPPWTCPGPTLLRLADSCRSRPAPTVRSTRSTTIAPRLPGATTVICWPIWFSTNTERGREMTILASRLRSGAEQWDAAAEFFKAPDRNMTGSSLWNDGQGTLYHFNGLEAGDGWGNLALVLRTSVDSGATWSPSRLINPEHQRRNQVISGTIRTKGGAIIQACDAVWSGQGGTAVHVSTDGGRTWSDPARARRRPSSPRASPAARSPASTPGSWNSATAG